MPYPSTGLLLAGGIGEGISQGVDSFLKTRGLLQQEADKKMDHEHQKQQLGLLAAKSNMKLNPETGGFDLTDFGQHEQEAAAAKEAAELGHLKSQTNKENSMASFYKTGKTDKDQSAAFDKTVSLLEGTRGQPAVQQAEKDIYAAKKVESLATLYGDPNKLSSAQGQLLASEVAKMAQGGSPTIEELRGLNTKTIPKALAQAAQLFSNKPEPANGAAFIKQFQDYARALKKDARGIIKDRYGRIIETNKKRVGDANYQNLTKQYINRFEEEEQSDGQQQEPDLKSLAAAELQRRAQSKQGGQGGGLIGPVRQ